MCGILLVIACQIGGADEVVIVIFVNVDVFLDNGLKGVLSLGLEETLVVDELFG